MSLPTADKSLASKPGLVRKEPLGNRRTSDVGLDGELNIFDSKDNRDAYKT